MQLTFNLRMKRKINHVLVILTSYRVMKIFFTFSDNLSND